MARGSGQTKGFTFYEIFHVSGIPEIKVGDTAQCSGVLGSLEWKIFVTDNSNLRFKARFYAFSPSKILVLFVV